MRLKYFFQDSRKISLIIPNFLLLISSLTTFWWIDWSKWNTWNALKRPVYGLIINEFQPIHLLIYWIFHNSLIHLTYVSSLFIIALISLDIDLEAHFKLIFGSILLLPFPVAILSQITGFTLLYLGNDYMWSVIFNFTFIGASMLGWTYIGASRDVDVIVLISFLAPLMYKIFFSGVLDFTPDIAHLLGYIFGRRFKN